MLMHQLAIACRGRWHGAIPVDRPVRICTDSRQLQLGDVFLALRGEHFDGHAFIAQLAGRASAIIGEASGRAKAAATPYLEVADSLRAFGDIAHAHRLQHRARLIAISGSCGKTTVRSMLAHGLRRLGYRLCETQANHNNLIGVPQTLLQINDGDQFAVVECGISERGEMQRLATMVEADVVVLTSIAMAHGEGLGELTDIAREKYRLAEAMKAHGRLIVAPAVAALLPQDERLLPASRMVRSTRQGVVCQLCWQGERASLTLPLPAAHLAADMALSASVLMHETDASLHEVAEALQGWQPVSQRLQIHQGINGIRLLDDCYNANPASMQAALDTLAQMPGRRIAILGDMAELGPGAATLHAALDVRYVDVLLLIGEQMQALAARQPKARWFADVSAWREGYAQYWQADTDDVVLVKASRSMHFEDIVNELKQPSLKREAQPYAV